MTLAVVPLIDPVTISLNVNEPVEVRSGSEIVMVGRAVYPAPDVKISIEPSLFSSSISKRRISPASVVSAFVETLGALSISISTFSYGSR